MHDHDLMKAQKAEIRNVWRAYCEFTSTTPRRPELAVKFGQAIAYARLLFDDADQFEALFDPNGGVLPFTFEAATRLTSFASHPSIVELVTE